MYQRKTSIFYIITLICSSYICFAILNYAGVYVAMVTLC